MFQRTILRQGQIAARSALSSRSISTAPLAVRRPLQLQSQLPQSFRPSIRQPAYRFYSTEKPAESEGKKEEAKEGEAAAAEQSPEDALRKELEDKKKEVTDLKDKYVRSVADFMNLQERTKRDMESARSFAIQKFAIDLLESIDNFDRALLAVPAEKLSGAEVENKDLLDLVTGLQMTQNVLMNSLKRHGVERFDPSEPGENGKPQKFDPNLHEATFMAKSENLEDGDVMYTQSKGFTLNGRTIRAAKVGVVRNS